MDCRSFLAQLTDYLDGEVSEGIRTAIQEHAAFCRKCNVVYNSARHTLQIVTECGADTYQLPDVVSERLYNRLRARLSEQSPRAG